MCCFSWEIGLVLDQGLNTSFIMEVLDNLYLSPSPTFCWFWGSLSLWSSHLLIFHDGRAVHNMGLFHQPALVCHWLRGTKFMKMCTLWEPGQRMWELLGTHKTMQSMVHWMKNINAYFLVLHGHICNFLHIISIFHSWHKDMIFRYNVIWSAPVVISQVSIIISKSHCLLTSSFSVTPICVGAYQPWQCFQSEHLEINCGTVSWSSKIVMHMSEGALISYENSYSQSNSHCYSFRVNLAIIKRTVRKKPK